MWQCASMIRCGWVTFIGRSSPNVGPRLGDARLPLVGRAVGLGGHERRLVEQPGAGARIELDDLQRVGRRPVEVALARRVQRRAPMRTCISRRCEPSGVTSSKSTTHSDPVAPRLLEALAGDLLAARARDLAVAMAEGRVAHRLEVHEGAHRGRVAGDDRARQLAALLPGGHEVVLGADVGQLVGHRPHHRQVLLVHGRRRPSRSGRRAPRRAATPPRRPRGPPSSGRYTVQVLSWKARSRHAVSAASSTSRGWKGVTPSMRKSSGKP